jgi:hypothetical protein
VRVTATGLRGDEAKTDLCHAVADGKIRVRLTVDAHAPLIGGRVLSGDNISVPLRLTPDDFDWVNSRPCKRWSVGPNGPQHYSHPWWDWQTQPIDLIELATADVQNIFGLPRPLSKRGVAAYDTSPKKRTSGRKSSFATPIRQAVFALMGYHGDLSDDDPQWSKQADVEKAVCAKLGDQAPRAESTIREHVSKSIAEWRSSKKADN